MVDLNESEAAASWRLVHFRNADQALNDPHNFTSANAVFRQAAA
jgi:hypothetical protein